MFKFWPHCPRDYLYWSTALHYMFNWYHNRQRNKTFNTVLWFKQRSNMCKSFGQIQSSKHFRFPKQSRQIQFIISPPLTNAYFSMLLLFYDITLIIQKKDKFSQSSLPITKSSDFSWNIFGYFFLIRWEDMPRFGSTTVTIKEINLQEHYSLLILKYCFT